MAGNNTKSSNLVNMNRNPTGRGGFQERPQDINRDGTWNPKMTFSFQYRRFLNMSADEFKDWDKNTPDSEKTVVEAIAWSAVLRARNNLNERREVAERVEGKPTQNVNMNVADVSAELDELESDYEQLGSEAEKQMVADESSL